jgi:hypothetical protein
MHQFLKFILFWNNTLHDSDGLSVHHQEFTTTLTASDFTLERGGSSIVSGATTTLQGKTRVC